MALKIAPDMKRLTSFCKKWNVAELAFFGSVLRDDFRPDSDIDTLVSFSPNVPVSLFDLVDMEEELSDILSRKVDVVCREGIEKSPNSIRKKAILESAEVMYAA